MNKYFVYDPDGKGLETYATIEERDAVAKEIIDLYKEEDEWCDSDSVESVIIGEITAKSKQCDRIERPDVLDKNGYDEAGNYWQKGIYFICDYRMIAI